LPQTRPLRKPTMATADVKPNQASVKLRVGLDLLGEVETAGEFDLAASTLTKILSNIAQSPEADKFRRLRMGNAKISALLATRGVRAILTGVGFVQEGDALFLPLDAPLDSLQQAVESLAAQQAARLDQAQAQNAALQAQRKADAEKENEERKRMKLQISDDAAARGEPGWTAKAAGVKGGKPITSCSDIGIGNSGGG